jgi:hypothetical protein
MSNQPRGLRASLVMDVRGVPEVLAAARLELARLLREAAQDESREVAAFAHRVAADFEAGGGHGEEI